MPKMSLEAALSTHAKARHLVDVKRAEGDYAAAYELNKAALECWHVATRVAETIPETIEGVAYGCGLMNRFSVKRFR